MEGRTVEASCGMPQRAVFVMKLAFIYHLFPLLKLPDACSQDPSITCDPPLPVYDPTLPVRYLKSRPTRLFAVMP